MPISWNEIRHNAIRFGREWAEETRERAEAKTFWDEFFAVFGIRRRLVASFEEPVKRISGQYGYIDLFWRVFSGIPGMGMPNTGPSDPGGQGTLTEQEMWQVVDYIQSLPFEPNSRPQFAPVNTEVVN